MRALFYALTLLIATGLLQACSDSNNNLSQLAELLGPDPISVATPDAERCEILDGDNRSRNQHTKNNGKQANLITHLFISQKQQREFKNK